MKTLPKIGCEDFRQEVADLAKNEVQKETIGSRLARLRRDRGLTQVELAKMLGLAQPNISDYERDIMRLNSELILKLTDILRVSADELLGLKDVRPGRRGGNNRRLARRLEEIERLTRRDQEALLRTIDAFLSKAS